VKVRRKLHFKELSIVRVSSTDPGFSDIVVVGGRPLPVANSGLRKPVSTASCASRFTVAKLIVERPAGRNDELRQLVQQAFALASQIISEPQTSNALDHSRGGHCRSRSDYRGKLLGGLNDTTIATMKIWRCNPALKEGEPVPTRIQFELDF
jgi:hypothetical protein